MKAVFRYLSFLLFGAFILSSCQTTKESFTEPVKDLNGTYRITNVVRNSVDITQWVDSSGFRLMMMSDNTYTLQGNSIPFLVNSNGKWSVDDPQYPYNLTFNPTDSTNAFTGRIGTPVSKGQRGMQVTFSPGCPNNSYVYTFEKIQ